MEPATNVAPETAVGPLPGILAAAAAAFLSLAFLKLGTPSVMDDRVTAPTNLAQAIFESWPMTAGLVALVAVAALAWLVRFDESSLRDRAPIPCAVFWLPAVWLAWQFVAALDTVSPKLTRPTLFHFAATTACFYLGCQVLGRLPRLNGFRLTLLGGFCLMLLTGLEQHFGGLEATREYFYSQPGLVEMIQRENPDFLVKLASNRIWGSLFYPNAFAGGILLLLPLALAFVWSLTEDRFETSARWVLVVLVATPALGCLYWTGSKTGLLLALLQGIVALAHLPIPKKIKLATGGVFLAVGLAGFFLVFADYFKGGARSLGARAGYWSVAVATFKSNPLTGTGPGTFMVPYSELKSEDAEMARLAHNDYLEQASDSGLVGFVSFIAFVWSSLYLLYRKSRRAGSWEFFLIWLGLAGWSLQIGMEFSLYIPGLAWPAFILFGLLWGLPEKPNAIDTAETQD